MHKTFDFKKYVEYKVYSVTTIKNGYGFRVLLTFADESTKTQQHAGFTTKREANAFRDEVIGQPTYRNLYCVWKNPGRGVYDLLVGRYYASPNNRRYLYNLQKCH